MRIKNYSLAVMALLLLAGCDMVVAPWKYRSLKAAAKQPITCVAGQDCDAKWARATQWVKKQSRLPLKKTDATVLLQTAKSPFSSTDAAFTIRKTALGSDGYSIDFTADCTNSLGCIPPVLELKADFTKFVLQQP